MSLGFVLRYYLPSYTPSFGPLFLTYSAGFGRVRDCRFRRMCIGGHPAVYSVIKSRSIWIRFRTKTLPNRFSPTGE